jgi:ATP-dependent protease ClpP protease subunit
MDPSGSDPITMLLTGGGSAGTGAVLAYLMMNKFKGGNGGSDAAAEMRAVANKLDQTNELLNELLRSHARLEGLLQHTQGR